MIPPQLAHGRGARMVEAVHYGRLSDLAEVMADTGTAELWTIQRDAEDYAAEPLNATADELAERIERELDLRRQDPDRDPEAHRNTIPKEDER